MGLRTVAVVSDNDDVDQQMVEMWPPAGLRLRHRDLELRYATARDALTLGPIAAGLLDPHEEHFMPNFAAGPGRAAQPAREVARRLWRRRAEFDPSNWMLPLVAVTGGGVVGCQSLEANQFAVIRDVHTGSYLDRHRHGAGLGTMMRAMVVEFSFAYLGALTMSSGYAEANVASAKISERLGYEPDGVVFDEFDGQRHTYRRVRLSRERWGAFRPGWLDDLEVVGADAFCEFIGVAPPQTCAETPPVCSCEQQVPVQSTDASNK